MRRIIIAKETDSKDFKKVSLLCGAEYQSNKGIIKLNLGKNTVNCKLNRLKIDKDQQQRWK